MQTDQVLQVIPNISTTSHLNNNNIASNSINNDNVPVAPLSNSKDIIVDTSQTFMHLTTYQLVGCLVLSSLAIYGLYYFLFKHKKIYISDKKNSSGEEHEKGGELGSEENKSFNCILEEQSFYYMIFSSFKFFFSILFFILCSRHTFNFI